MTKQIIRFQAYDADVERILRLQAATEARSMSEVMRAALRAYEAQTRPRTSQPFTIA